MKIHVCIFILLQIWDTSCAQQQDSVTRKKWQQTTFVKTAGIPIALTTLGLYVAEDNAIFSKYDARRTTFETFPGFSSNLDDFLRYAPPAAVYGLDLVGVESKNNFRDKSLIFLKANLMAFAVAFPLKALTKVRRPDNSNSASFPSIHTTQAFVGATFLHKELGYRSRWYSIGAYSVATFTGIYRVLNDKHWLSDVLVGAALGILSTNIAYLTHHYKPKNKNSKVSTWLMPNISSRSYGASITLVIH